MELSSDKISRYGRSLITNLYILYRTTGIYDSANETIRNSAARLLADCGTLLEESGEFTIKIIEGAFYIEGARIKASVAEVDSFSILASEFLKRSIGVLDIRSPLSAEDLINLVYVLRNGIDAADIQSQLEERHTTGISVGGPVALQKEEGVDLKDSAALAKSAYLKAVGAVRELDNALKGGRRFKLKRVKRALQLMVDGIIADESHLVALAMRRNYENYSFFHPVNVAVLSVVLGKKLGLSRVYLRTLATAALFHDAGKAEIPAGILNKKTELNPLERELLRRHPLEGVKVFLKTFGLNETTICSMLVSFEHHMKLDLSGYPQASDSRKLNILSRIVSIADDFDILVSGKVEERKRMAAHQALAKMSGGSGSLYDPVLMKAFVSIFA